ncbi:hypothetical protein EYC84_003281 [Monilinia fructicola]|uniref:Uncharacterized protein n=1 Tax=Monilinia fructicola TaxID=38448 RepID=A0A5M9JVH7_MONFR|nr:hypothetical protein EYC84_003281 [Monilinia fructicola]
MPTLYNSVSNPDVKNSAIPDCKLPGLIGRTNRYCSKSDRSRELAWTLCIVKIHPPKLYELGSSAAFVTLVQISASEVPHARKMGRFRCRSLDQLKLKACQISFRAGQLPRRSFASPSELEPPKI